MQTDKETPSPSSHDDRRAYQREYMKARRADPEYREKQRAAARAARLKKIDQYREKGRREQKKRRERLRDELNQKSREYYRLNRDALLTINKINYKTDPRRKMLSAARVRANALGVPFAITVADISIPERCPILGINLEVGDGRQHASSPSIDRLVPSLGYVPGNIHVISLRANRMKYDASIDDVRSLLTWMEKAMLMPVPTEVPRFPSVAL